MAESHDVTPSGMPSSTRQMPKQSIPMPTGTVSFLFTDIEGSTDLVQKYPEAVQAWLARHHRLLQQAMDAHHGHIFQIVGDAFCVAFPTMLDALQAAVAAQHFLHHEAWPVVPIRVRMGIHTGAAQAGNPDDRDERQDRSGGYTGYETLARVQRVMSAAHGGQVLVSHASAELVRSQLPAGVTLRDMGTHRLKGFVFPERLWQVDAPDLPQAFPPLRTQSELSRTPPPLPEPLTSFIGRTSELAELERLLPTTRLLTLTGVGGTGKTRLALELAAHVSHSQSAARPGGYADGVWLVELAPLSDPALVAQTVAAVFGVTNQTNNTYVDTLRVLLAGKHLLLLLDNCEHVIQECAQVSEALLRACPSLHIVATSREPLNIQGEVAWRVPSLRAEESAQLFAECARAVKTDFVLNEQNAEEVNAICTQLDGIPLAIELAAARLSGMSVQQLAARLDDRFNLLSNGRRTALARHQTLRALIAWSFDLLADQEQALLRRLSVFAGGWTAEAAEAVCAMSQDPPDGMATLYASSVLPLLLGLVNKSLVVANDLGEQTRYHMLGTIRQYAWDQLESAGEVARIQARHARHFLTYLKRTSPAKMRETNSPISTHSLAMECVAWVTSLQSDRDNLRAALTWSLQQGHDVDTGIQLALWHQDMWMLRGPRSEGRRWLELALAHTDAREPTQTRARVLVCLASFVFWTGDVDKSLDHFTEALTIFRREDDRRGIMFTLARRGDIGQESVDVIEANYQEWLSIARELDDPVYIGAALWHLGSLYEFKRDNLTQALSLYAESLATLPKYETGLRHVATFFQAMAQRRNGRPEGTLEQVHDALAFFRVSGFMHGVVFLLAWLGELSIAEGDYAKAREYLYEGLEIGYRNGSRGFTNSYFGSLAALVVTEGRFVQAVTLAAIGEKLSRQPLVGHRLDLVNAARAQLDAQTLASAEAAGRAMSFDQAVAYALAGSSVGTFISD